MTTVLTKRGQLAVPAEIRKRRGLKEGDLFEWFDDGEALYIVCVPKDPVRALRGSLKGTGLYDALMEERRRERERE